MKIELLKTFLEVSRTLHFRIASENLFITQSTVSSRIRMLEESLNISLFTRTRNDIQLTEAGRKLLPQAEMIVSQWEETKKNIINTESDLFLLTVGSVSSIWDIVLQDWLVNLKREIPKLIFKGESLGSSDQIKHLLAKTIDIGFMFEPPKMSELKSREIVEVELCLVSTNPDISTLEAVSTNYTYVEWGTSFQSEHSRWFPEIPIPKVRLDLGEWAIDYLLTAKGSAYLAKSMLKKHLRNKKLFLVKEAPKFKRVAYAAYNSKSKNIEHIQASLDILFKTFEHPNGNNHQ